MISARFDVPAVLETIVARGVEGFGVVVFHGAEAIAFLSPDDADAKAAELVKLATLARNPGKCPCEIGL